MPWFYQSYLLVLYVEKKNLMKESSWEKNVVMREKEKRLKKKYVMKHFKWDFFFMTKLVIQKNQKNFYWQRTQLVIKLKKNQCDKIKKFQIVTKIKKSICDNSNSYFDKTQKIQLW